MARRGRGEGSIFRRKDRPGWVAQLAIGTTSAGRTRYWTRYAKTRREAAGLLATAIEQHRRGIDLAADRQTLAVYLKAWLSHVVAPGRKARTYRSAELNVRRVIPYIGRIRLDRLRAQDVQKCYGALLERGLAPRTVRQAHEVLHAALAQALRWDLIHRNVVSAAIPPRVAKREMQTYSRDQLEKIFAITVGDRLHAFWVVLGTTGLRLGEILGLRWQDTDLDNGRFQITQTLRPEPGVGMVVAETKTPGSARQVWLADETTLTVVQHRRRQLEERLEAGPEWQENGLVFCLPNGSPLSPYVVRAAWKKVVAKAGLPYIRIHDLRHTAATLMLSDDIHPKIVQEMLGHTSIATTLDTYSHVAPSLHRQAAQMMGALLPKGVHK